MAPFPVADFRQVLAVRVDVLLVLNQFDPELFLQAEACVSGSRKAINRIHDGMKTVKIIEHSHVEGRGNGAFFLITANVDIVVIGAALRQAMNQPWIRMKRENDRRAFGE